MKYSKAPTVIFRLPIRSQQQRTLLFILASIEDSSLNPTQSLLGYMIDAQRTKISSHLNELAAEGWIKKDNPNNRFDGDTCKYHINWNKIEKYTTDKDYYTVADTEPENSPNKTEYPNPQPKEESPSEGQESGKNEVLEIKSSVLDVDDSDNDFRYAQTDPYENPELSFLLDDDEFEKFEEERKNNEIIHKIICKDMDGNVNAEYVDDIVMVLKRAIKDGIVDWSVITDGVNSISQKYRKSKMEVDGLIKMVLNMQAA